MTLHKQPASQILSSNDFDEGSGPIFLDQLRCSSSEQSLLDCPSGRGVGVHRCTHAMDVGLSCAGMYVSIHGSCVFQSIAVR